MTNKEESFNPLVSCIIPVYNASAYLKQCVDSLLKQTYNNIEILLIDDVSTDNSWDLCLEYVEQFSNIRAFKNKKNTGGPFRGRERGIKEAVGEWVTFIDCDDYVLPEYVENLLKATNFGKYDIAVTGHSRLYENGVIEHFLWNDYSQTTDERLTSFYEHFLNNDFWTDPADTSGQNLIRASICKSIDLSKFSNRVYAEDSLLALLCIANSKNGVNFVDSHDFIWRQVEGSGSHGGFSNTANKEEFIQACFTIFHKQDIYRRISKKLPLISIIVPVYNTENYLSRCIDSIVLQSYKNIEVIAVNDGSPDRSQILIEKYQKNDKRIKSVIQENKGLNLARAAGFKIAQGEYISYVDSDDFIHPDYIRSLYELLRLNSADISMCAYKAFTYEDDLDNNYNSQEICNYRERVLNTTREALEFLLLKTESTEGVHQMTAWGKLYKSKIIENTDWQLANYRRHEDNLESLQWYSNAQDGVAISSMPLYYYRQTPNSITQTTHKNINPDGKELGYFEYLNELYEKVKEYLNDDSYDITILNYFTHLNRTQINQYSLTNKFTEEELSWAIRNEEKIQILFNQEIEKRNYTIHQKSLELTKIYSSKSWWLTRPIRRLKSLLKVVSKHIKPDTQNSIT